MLDITLGQGQYIYSLLYIATCITSYNNSYHMYLGQFGVVYKAYLAKVGDDDCTQDVAVKILKGIVAIAIIMHARFGMLFFLRCRSLQPC